MKEQPMILVVDDQHIVRKLARTVLYWRGYETVLEAADANSALDIARTNQKPPDLLLTDVNLGGGMNGIQLAEAISERWPSTKIILMSGNYERRLEMKPAWRFLEKPFAPGVLIETVEELLADTGQWNRPSRLILQVSR